VLRDVGLAIVGIPLLLLLVIRKSNLNFLDRFSTKKSNVKFQDDYANCCLYRVDPPDGDEQQACSKRA